ncbi:beta-lactamase-like protein, partial [Syncephalis pseudoplumigaleata]
MRWFAQVVGTASPDTTPSIVVHFDSQRYLFNCGEGTQRLFVENGVRANKVTNVFLTRLNWDCIGGVPGMILTLADAGVRRLHFHGGPNLTHFMAANRHFVARTGLSVKVNEYPLNDGQFFEDENMTVRVVELNPATRSPPAESSDSDSEMGTTTAAHEQGAMKRKHDTIADAASADEAIALKRQFIDIMFPGQPAAVATSSTSSAAVACPADPAIVVSAEQLIALRRQFGQRMPRTRPARSALCYIAQGRDVLGRFDPKAAVALGLKPGPIFGKPTLKRGESVTMPDGTVIQPQQVVGPSRPGAIFVVLDCPSVDYIDALVASDELNALAEAKDTESPRCIFHLLGDGVIEHQAFQAWIRRFPSSTQHIILTEQCTPALTQFRKSAECQLRLNQLDPSIFPLSYAYLISLYVCAIVLADMPNACVGETNLMYFMEPKPSLDRSQVPTITDYTWAGSVGKEIRERVEFTAAIEQAHRALEEERAAHAPDAEHPGHEIVVTTLGTGSALPSKCRNVSATLLQIPAIGNIMLDAGEGTLGQLRRHFNIDSTSQGADDCLRKLKMIFVSHLHADHHLGVIRLIVAWQRVTDQHPLYIVGPWRFWSWLQEYNGVEQLYLSNIRFIGAPDLHYTLPDDKASPSARAMLNSLGLSAIRTTDVIHCPMAYAISIEHQSGWKIVYSGDTRPCNKLVEMGQQATLLIHEATLEDTMRQEAIDKKHSTTSEAVDVGQRMNAYAILLTHFSQRYPRVPPLNYIPPRTGFAFDMMRVAIGELWKMPTMLPAIRTLFP